MKKKFIIVGIVALVITLICVYGYSRDNIRFKMSYEVNNNMEYSNGKKIKVSIPLDNRVKYIGSEKLLKILKEGTGVIYFGYSTCPWCRNAIPILIDSIKENDIKTLYYVDTHEIDLENISDELYEKLDPYLKEDEDGNKRLAVPDVYVVKNGEIKGHHLGTVESYKNPYLGMNDDQKEELKKIYDDLIKELK